ncbi:RsiV family protein [Solilutibacter silvestris]|uniref:RsiV family protein n=1 Tax=Solilutibacter silvestris TaxID=1645665 RepID=UPI003D34EC76
MVAMLACTVVLAASCKREQPANAPTTAAPPAAAVAPVVLQDQIEHTQTYLLGITYPKGMVLPSGLAREMKAYADASRKRLVDAAAPHKAGDAGVPYDMSLEFRQIVPQAKGLIAIAADGSLYSGGAQGDPLIRRFLWDAQGGSVIRAQDLLTGDAGWVTISNSVRETLIGQIRARMEDDKQAPEEIDKAVAKMKPIVEAGTQPAASGFSEFEPMIDAEGKLVGLTFVFPPYQVAGYSDGIQRADVPVAVFQQYLNPKYRNLFE